MFIIWFLLEEDLIARQISMPALFCCSSASSLANRLRL